MAPPGVIASGGGVGDRGGVRLATPHRAGELGVLAEEIVAGIAGGALPADPVIRWSGLHRPQG